jgi:Cu/Ag efflux protein CusF
MPLGSPGMEGPRSEPYDVLLFQADGRHAVYQYYAASGSNQMSPSAGAADGKTAMSEGEVRKVDKGAGKITIKHGPLLNLDMPGMTMVFRVSKAALLDQVKSGDKIKFVADKTDGTLIILHIEPVK